MHGRKGEESKRRRHMWPVPALGTTVAADSTTSTTDSFCKNGRKISVGDCALFKPPQESPPFIGIIRWLTLGKEDNLKLGVNWLYRPTEVKLSKGILLEAAPNEIFYSFHKDEIPAASLLHPCKVTFLRKGVELPSGISSFVCRRVYDIENKCLWWLTDQDYVNERQEEVDELLEKTRLEMHVTTVQSGGRSPKSLIGPASSPQLKPGSESVQNSATPFSSPVRAKRKERGDQVPEPIKRERSLKTGDGDSGHFRLETMLKSEIAKITDKGGLIDIEGVEKLVQLMRPDRTEKKIDLAGKIMLVDVIAATDRDEFLRQFVQLRVLHVLDEWLQEVHKGKIGDGSSLKDSDKSAEKFLFALLRALDKLPVDLHALQTSHVGKSVNHLRSHKNVEIQKKARSLVDTWKKRVEAEMKMNDRKPGFPDISHRRTEVAIKSSIIQPSASRALKLGQGDALAKSTSASPGSVKLLAPLPSLTSSKDSLCKMSVCGGTSDTPLTSIKEEKSSSSSQSQNNSQSYSSDHAKTVGSSWKEDVRSSTAGSMSVNNKTSSGVSRHRKSSNGIVGSSFSGVQKEIASSKCSSLNRNSTSEKISQSGLTCERVPDLPLIDNGSSHRLIVRLPNPGRSPARTASGGSVDDPSIMVSRTSSPGVSERHDRKVKGKSEAGRANIGPDSNMESWQSNDVKDVLAGSDDGDGSPGVVLDDERCRTSDESVKMTEALKAASSSPRNEHKSGNSYSSMNALIESCVKCSEISASISVGDDIGMNLLASVAAGEMSKSDLNSPVGSPRKHLSTSDDYYPANDAELRSSHEDVSQVKDGLKHNTSHAPDHCSGDNKTITAFSEEKSTGESSKDLQQTASQCLKTDGKSDEITPAAPIGALLMGKIEECAEGGSANEIREKRKIVVTGENASPDLKTKPKNFIFDENKKIDPANEKISDDILSRVPALVLGSMGDPCEIGNAALNEKVVKQTIEESPVCHSMDISAEENSFLHEGSNGGISKEQKLLVVASSCSETAEGSSKNAVLPSGSDNALGSENVDDLKDEAAEDIEVRGLVENTDNQRVDKESGVLAIPDCSSDGVGGKSERKEILEHSTSPCGESPPISVEETEHCMKSTRSKTTAVEADEMEKCEPTAEDSSLSVRAGSDMASKLDFDLNEGFATDEGNQAEPETSVPSARMCDVHLPSPLAFPVSSMSSGLPAPITVTSAAKGPFVHPETLLRSKGELGWKGSAATSAFRPAEPRKVVEMPLCMPDIPPDSNTAKQGRQPLDFDLNVPDERAVEESQIINNHDSGGLNLDLNRVDEDTEIGQFSVSTRKRLEMPLLPDRPSSSGGFSNGEVNILRDFDLNNGPSLDEGNTEPASGTQHAKSSVPFLPPSAGLRINNTELGNVSWFSPGNPYPAITIPSIIPDRADHHYSIISSNGAPRILGPPTGGTNFRPDVYRGPVLTSSPAMAFSSATPFQYPGGFPFGTNFPLPSTSFTGSTYTDTSSGSALCFPTIPSQLVGPAGTVSGQYPRPFMISLPDGVGNVEGENSRRRGRQGLDLNAGPGGADIEARDERPPSVSRQFSVAGSQALLAEEQMRMYQAAAGMSKRKEPDGGWDPERFRYKQPSWQ